MRTITNIFVAGMVVGMFMLGISTFIGGLSDAHGVTEPDSEFLDETQAIFDQTKEIRSSTENVTAKETGNLDRAASFIGGTFQTLKLPWKSTNILRALATSMGEKLHIPILGDIIKYLFVLLGIVVTIEFLLYVRGLIMK